MILADQPTVTKDQLFARRPDLKTLLLDGPNTVGEVPYLEIVTEVLEAVLRGRLPEDADLYAWLAEARFPAAAPFHLADVRMRRYLAGFAVPPADLYRAAPGSVRTGGRRPGCSPRPGWTGGRRRWTERWRKWSCCCRRGW
ncbi:Tc toxin subunit A [Actinoplanes derwentensis]|uniref:Virulence plasmid A protein n=1 Tax=Actinoplanes derwentensis TaxID=113562 RepID=A0A1H2DER3_9ACTN|nr:hypothetical protein Ade03nite_37200 [Actinoplanes derwentensis]SDT81074.1 virulence plasmid A protein [Actinoplanes derwentensis]